VSKLLDNLKKNTVTPEWLNDLSRHLSKIRKEARLIASEMAAAQDTLSVADASTQVPILRLGRTMSIGGDVVPARLGRTMSVGGDLDLPPSTSIRLSRALSIGNAGPNSLAPEIARILSAQPESPSRRSPLSNQPPTENKADRAPNPTEADPLSHPTKVDSASHPATVLSAALPAKIPLSSPSSSSREPAFPPQCSPTCVKTITSLTQQLYLMIDQLRQLQDLHSVRDLAATQSFTGSDSRTSPRNTSSPTSLQGNPVALTLQPGVEQFHHQVVAVSTTFSEDELNIGAQLSQVVGAGGQAASVRLSDEISPTDYVHLSPAGAIASWEESEQQLDKASRNS
jgi:hypothetical protein